MTSRGDDPRQSPGLGYKRVVSCKDSFHGTDVLAVSEHGAPGRRPNIHAHFVGRQREDGHGGKAKNDKIDAHKIAVLVRGGMLPMAYVYPREMRATRDLLRRRCHFTRKRAELLTHIQNTASQYLLPTLGKIAYHGNRVGVAEHFRDPEVRKSVETNLALIDEYDRLLTELELHLTQTAKVHDVNAFYRLRSVPGIGKILALVVYYMLRRGQAFEVTKFFSGTAGGDRLPRAPRMAAAPVWVQLDGRLSRAPRARSVAQARPHLSSATRAARRLGDPECGLQTGGGGAAVPVLRVPMSTRRPLI